MRLHLAIAACLVAGAAWGQPRKAVLMITDAEGVAGVCRQDQTDPKDLEMRQLLTGEINAAVEGFLAAGATEVVVWDGHDGSQTLSVLTVHPKAKLLMGAQGYSMTMERGYAAVAFVGQHAKANVRRGIMAHSYSSLGVQKMLMNGQPVGEIETRTALAGWYGVPVVMLSGDQAAADDLKAIVPGAEVAVVKEGLGYYSCLSLSAQAAREAIRKAAQRGLERVSDIPPYKVNGPVTLEVEYTTRSTLGVDAGLSPGSEIMDARSMRYRGKDFLEAWQRFRK